MSADDLPALFHSIERRLDALAAHVDRRDDALTSEVEGIKDDVLRLERAVTDAPARFVSLDRYGPVERLVYGVTAAILLTVVGAVLALVIQGSS